MSRHVTAQSLLRLNYIGAGRAALRHSPSRLQIPPFPNYRQKPLFADVNSKDFFLDWLVLPSAAARRCLNSLSAGSVSRPR